jgi:hypothetical protein
MVLISRLGIVLAISAACAAPAAGQPYDVSRPAGGPFSSEPVTNAPFSADATTRFQELQRDGTVRVYTVNARYYRDSRGRVRVEIDTRWGPYVMVDTGDRVQSPTVFNEDAFYVMDPTKRTYRTGFGPRVGARLANGEGRVALPVGKVCFQVAPPVLAGASDEERLQAVHAEVAQDIGIVTSSHRSDRIGVVDYEVTNIRREEPSAMLFEVPTDYTRVSMVGVGEDPLISFPPWQSPPACKPMR